MIENEVDRVLKNPDHVIMSDGLEISLSSDSFEEYLDLDNNVLVCELISAKRHSKSSWELQLSVPGITFHDFASLDKAVFHHDNFTFLLTDNFEFINDTGNTITARATRIFKENE